MDTQKHYEGMFVLHNREVPEGDIADPEEATRSLIEKVGGETASTLVWANRKLAYAIEGNQTGTYVLAYFSGDSNVVAELQRLVGITDRCLRLVAFSLPAIPAEGDRPGPLTEPAARGGSRREAEEEAAKAATAEIAEASAEGPPSKEAKAKLRAARLNYTNVYHLRRMVTAQGKLFPRVRSGLSAKDQRMMRQSVLRARTLALLPYLAR